MTEPSSKSVVCQRCKFTKGQHILEVLCPKQWAENPKDTFIAEPQPPVSAPLKIEQSQGVGNPVTPMFTSVSAPECEMKGLEVPKMTDSAQPTPEGTYTHTGFEDGMSGPGWPPITPIVGFTNIANYFFAQGQSAERAKWEKLKAWLRHEWPRTHYEYSVLERMSELEAETLKGE